MITLISTPEYTDSDGTYRWLATESPNNFRLLRRDWLCNAPVNNGGYLQITVTEDFTGKRMIFIAVLLHLTGSRFLNMVEGHVRQQMITGWLQRFTAGWRSIIFFVHQNLSSAKMRLVT